MIQSVERAVKLLRLVADCGTGVRLCELARGSGLNRNTVYNLAETLVHEGLLGKTSDSLYIVGDAMNELVGKAAGRLVKAEGVLRQLHLKHAAAYIYYSELGASDVIVRFHYLPGRPGVAIYPDMMTLPPYLTVGGLVFLAFALDERLVALRMKAPFDYHGLQAWKSEGEFMKALGAARKKGYTETPWMVPETELKVGIPVWDKSGMVAAAMTFDIKDFPEARRGKALADAMKASAEINRVAYGATKEIR